MRSFAQKLGLKENMRIHLINVPVNYYELAELDQKAEFTKLNKHDYEFVHIFSSDENKLIKEVQGIIPHLTKDALLWISWPKKSSKIDSTLDKWKVMEIGQAAGLVDVKILSYNQDWSSLKFVYRLKDR